MKAKIIETGLIIDVYKCSDGKFYQSECGRTIGGYTATELDPNIGSELNEVNFAKKQSVAINGWIARTEFGDLELYTEYPERLGIGSWYSQLGELTLPTDYFHDLKWSDEPLAVTIQISKK